MLTGIGGEAIAQRAATVPASSPIYERLESVTAYFPTAQFPLGVRPVSRERLIQVVDSLTARVLADSGAGTRRTWALGELRVIAGVLLGRGADAEGGNFSVLGASATEVLVASSAPDTIESNGLGSIDAVTHPFGDLRHGRASERGTVLTTLPTVALGWRSSVAAMAEPRVTIYSPPGASARAEVLAHRAYVRGVYRNVAVQVGMDELLWGQTATGALFISGNAMPLPAIVVATASPVRMPWILRYAGPVNMVAMLADLGRAQDPRHTKLAGWHVAVQPWNRFELGVSVLAQQGGEGGPEATLLERVVDLFPLIDALAPQRADLQFSNKLAGGNLRVRFPELSGLDIHYDLMIDDFDLRRFESTVIDEFSHVVGARLPVLVNGGLLAIRAELHNTSLRVYEHTQFRSGVTFRDRLIGNPLGPNAKGARTSVTWRPRPTVEIGLAAWDNSRDPSLYTSTASGTHDEGFRLIRVSDEPRHHRRGLALSVAGAAPGGSIRTDLGYNRAWRTGQQARDEWGLIVAFSSRWLPTF